MIFMFINKGRKNINLYYRNGCNQQLKSRLSKKMTSIQMSIATYWITRKCEVRRLIVNYQNKKWDRRRILSKELDIKVLRKRKVTKKRIYTKMKKYIRNRW